jgi:RNA polymerase sigma factor (sigma-70 family)
MPRLPFKLPLASARHQALSDKDLISACLRGEHEAWNALIGRYVALIYSVCLRTGLSGADAEDVSQDVCVILLDHLADLRDNTKLSSWLISTAKREAWRFQRRKGLKLASEMGDEEWALDSGSPLTTQSAESPEASVLALEDQHLVRRGLESLQERCRRMLTLLRALDPRREHRPHPSPMPPTAPQTARRARLLARGPGRLVRRPHPRLRDAGTIRMETFGLRLALHVFQIDPTLLPALARPTSSEACKTAAK